MRVVLAGAALAFGMASAATAETTYVTDMLQLGLHRAADTSDRAFENLTSGAALQVLERNGNYARVRTAGGDEGWVKAAYIVSEPPARYRLAQLETEVRELREQAAASRTAADGATREADLLRTRWTSEKEAATTMRETLTALERENAAYAERFERYRLSLPLSWVATALVLALVGGGLAGWFSLDRLIRRRYAGYRLY